MYLYRGRGWGGGRGGAAQAGVAAATADNLIGIDILVLEEI